MRIHSDFFLLLHIFSPTTSRNGPCVQDKYGFAEAIDKSLLFYEAQRSGDLPESEMRIKWRKDSAMNDRGNNGEDLTGGYYDGTYIYKNRGAISCQILEGLKKFWTWDILLLKCPNRSGHKNTKKCWFYHGVLHFVESVQKKVRSRQQAATRKVSYLQYCKIYSSPP